MAGRFWSFEGIDGSGKSTQARMLADRLIAMGHQVVLTREPGGSPGAEEIRRLVLEGAADRWSIETELLLFTAARRDHLEKTIRPALARGCVVICDRFADSSRVYQGLTRIDQTRIDQTPIDQMRGDLARGNLARTVDHLHDLMIGVEPDLTFLIDIDAAAGLSRAINRPGKELRFEGMGLGVQQRARDGFLALARDNPFRFAIFPGARAIQAVADDVLNTALGALKG